MSASRAVLALIVVAATFIFIGYMTGKTAPASESDRKMKTSFEALQKKLPTLVVDWVKKEFDQVEIKEFNAELKLARFTGPSDVKVTLYLSLKLPEVFVPFFAIPQHFSIYLHFFDGQWTSTRVDCSPKMAEIVGSLMLAIDQEGGK